MLNPYDDGRRGGQNQGRERRSHHGGGGQPPQHNPFEMMNSHMQQMSHMMNSMDSMFDGRMQEHGRQQQHRDPRGGGDRRVSQHGGRGGADPFQMMNSMMGGGMLGGGMMGGMMGDMGSMMGGGGGGGSYSCSSSSCCYSSSSGAGGQPHTVQYSSSSHGVQRPGEDLVHETHRQYRDSSGTEKLGVSRRIGDRGRSVTAVRDANGMEERRDNLINVQDGASFDSEWRGNATATHINQARSQMPQMRSQAQPGLGFVPQSTQPRERVDAPA